MKDRRFDLTNLPLSFLNDFHDIEIDEVKQAILDVVNLLYDDYSIEEVQNMFATFAATSYEIYQLTLLYRSDFDTNSKFKLDLLIEVILFCASQLESYNVRQIHRNFHNSAKVISR